jgi:hypothetical protein
MTKSLKLPKISVKALFPSAALKHGHNETLQMRIRHNNRIIRAGGKKKRKTRKNRKKKGGSKTCGCGSTPSTVVSYPAGSSSSMSPNPNDNIQSSQQQFADSACASTGDAMGDSWNQTGGSDLGKFIESLNNMSGGKRRKSRIKKRKTKKCSKKRLSKKIICFKGTMKHLKKMKKNKTKKEHLTRCSKLRLKK